MTKMHSYRQIVRATVARSPIHSRQGGYLTLEKWWWFRKIGRLAASETRGWWVVVGGRSPTPCLQAGLIVVGLRGQQCPRKMLPPGTLNLKYTWYTRIHQGTTGSTSLHHLFQIMVEAHSSSQYKGSTAVLVLSKCYLNVDWVWLAS